MVYSEVLFSSLCNSINVAQKLYHLSLRSLKFKNFTCSINMK